METTHPKNKITRNRSANFMPLTLIKNTIIFMLEVQERK